MRKQQLIWENEHKRPEFLPTLEYIEPSSGVRKFVSFLNKVKFKPPKKVVDVGCGKGRNTIYLAGLGYDVYGLDYIQYAINYTRKSAKKNNLLSKIHLYTQDLGKKWPFQDNFFDLAVDCFSSIDIEIKGDRERYRDELFRTLKYGGYTLIMVVSVNDEIEKEFLKNSPGTEKNTTIWPGTGKFQKDYDEKELRKFYEKFRIIDIKENKKKAFKLGRDFVATNYWLVLQKPKNYEL